LDETAPGFDLGARHGHGAGAPATGGRSRACAAEAARMRYRTLGRTGLRVSELGIGGAQIGLRNYMEPWDPDAPTSAAQIVDLVHHAESLGYNYIDTAASYGDGRSEEVVGQALHGRRERWVLATKCDWRGTADEVAASVERSLHRLQTDHIDVMQFHGGDFTAAQAAQILHGGPLEALLRLRAAGKIRFLGVTAEEPVTLRPLIASGAFDVVQIRFNVLYQGAWDNILPEAAAAGLGVVVMRPATSGLLGKLLRASCPEGAAALEARCNLAELALNFVLSAPQVSVAIVGMRRRAEAEANARLSDDGARRLDQAWLHDRFVHPGTA
jgi:aryl-alcohol dehydrogenase-like predicted oxidoreductase